ncbi:MAG TPA: hypothetical protein VIG76_11600 [Amnibacterium sp.]|jgi:hypothetical protein|uniref:hypothetical protein n=1 Tax=Amnibacterium sp. TaxID=1872496 RepID=UPI002F94AFB7
MRPVRLNLALASLFAVGSACFALGSVPAYANAVGATADSVTFFVGSLFFTAASFLQLVQAQTPAMTGVDGRSQHVPSRLVLGAWLPQDRGWLSAAVQLPGTLFFNISTLAALVHNATVQQQDRHVWRPDLFGSILFLVASALALLAARSLRTGPSRTWPLAIGWVNMAGSVFFMASALGSFVLPSTGGLVDVPVAVGGTFLGALCFLVGALLLLPAWRAALTVAPPAVHPIETRSPT